MGELLLYQGNSNCLSNCMRRLTPPGMGQIHDQFSAAYPLASFWGQPFGCATQESTGS